MAQQELINYVDSQRSQGFSDTQIKKALNESGWAKADIDMVMSGGGVIPKLPSVGDLISECFDIFQKHFVVLFLLGVIPQLIAVLASYGILSYSGVEFNENFDPRTLFEGAYSLMTLVSVIVGIGIFTSLVTLVANLTSIQYLAARDQKPAVGVLLSNSVGLMFGYIFTYLMVMLCVIGGAVLFLIPAFLLSLYLSLVQYVFVIEGVHGFAALARSFELVRGSFWAVLWRGFVFGIVIWILSLVLGGITGLISGVSGVEEIQMVVNSLSNGITVPLYLIFQYLLYTYLAEIHKAKGETQSAPVWVLKVAMILGGLTLVGMIALSGYAVSQADFREGFKEGFTQQFEAEYEMQTNNDVQYEWTEESPEKTEMMQDEYVEETGIRRDN